MRVLDSELLNWAMTSGYSHETFPSGSTSTVKVLHSSGAVHSCLLYVLALTTAIPLPIQSSPPVFLHGVAALGMPG